MSLQEMSTNETKSGDSPAADPGQQPGSDPSKGSGTEEVKLAAWTQQVSKEIRENPELAKELAPFEKLDDLVKAHFDQKKKSAIPGRDAKPEEVAAFWRQLGHPEKPDGYTLAKEENAGSFLAAAHAARLTDEQASRMWQEATSEQARLRAGRDEVQKAEFNASMAALKQEYGDKFNQAIELFDRAVGNTGAENSLLMSRLLDAGLVGNHAVIKAFIALGAARQESSSPSGESPPAGGLKSVTDGGWYNYGSKEQ
jgi:hypothetical protein